MINTETIERNEKSVKKSGRIIRRVSMFFVALLCCLVATASSSWLSSERVVAVSGIPVLVNKVTQEDINNAKKKRDAAKQEANKAKEKISNLKGQKDQLTGELSKLNQANADQKAQYELIASQLQAAHPIAQYLNSLKTGSTAGEMTQAQIENLFSSLAPAYDEDYFTAAWLYPNEVGGDTNRIVPSTLRDYGANIGGAVQSDSVGTYVDSMSTSLLRTNYGTLERVSQYALNLLEGMANYVTRNNYAGSRAVEQILARFGVRVPDTRLQRCEFIGADDTDVQFAEVTAMADSGDYKVGQFAGKGVALGSDGNWTIECKEYGYIVIVSTIVPKISYVQGFDRHVIHRNRFDFYTPEFDCVGPQAIAAGELYCQSNDSEADPFDDLVAGNGHPTDVFGYCPRFAEYKTSKDSLLGDFNIPHLNAGLDSFYFSRLLKPNGAFPLKAQGPFLFADGRQYNRIFNVKDQDTDHFYMWYKFDIKAMRPMRSISDSIPLDGDGEKIAQQPNGVHLS